MVRFQNVDKVITSGSNITIYSKRSNDVWDNILVFKWTLSCECHRLPPRRDCQRQTMHDGLLLWFWNANPKKEKKKKSVVSMSWSVCVCFALRFSRSMPRVLYSSQRMPNLCNNHEISQDFVISAPLVYLKGKTVKKKKNNPRNDYIMRKPSPTKKSIIIQKACEKMFEK